MPRKPSKKNQVHKFVHFSSMNSRGYQLYWVILLFFFTAIISMPFVKVDVTVQSRGVITSANKASVITSPLTAKVEKITIKENQKVRQGDTLIILHQEGIQQELINLQQQIELHDLYLSDLNTLTESSPDNDLGSALYLKEKEDFTKQIAQRNNEIRKLSIDYSRTSKLYIDGVVSLSAFQKDSFALKNAESELLTYKAGVSAKWEMDKKNFQQAATEMQSRLENLKQSLSQYMILAPFDGYIINFNGIAQGGFVNENDKIAILSPSDELIAECYISPKDIGLIGVQMPVRIQVDTYDYNQWGLLEGHIFEVAEDVINMEGEFKYLVRCELDKEYLVLSNGVKGKLKKGMSLTGRFVVTQRTLFQLVFDNIDDWLNPKIIE